MRESWVADAFVLAHRFSRYWKRSGDCFGNMKFDNSKFSNDGCTSSEKKALCRSSHMSRRVRTATLGQRCSVSHPPHRLTSAAAIPPRAIEAFDSPPPPPPCISPTACPSSTQHSRLRLCSVLHGIPQSIVALSGRPDELTLEPTPHHSCSICCSPLVHLRANHERYANADKPVQRRRHPCMLHSHDGSGVPSRRPCAQRQ